VSAWITYPLSLTHARARAHTTASKHAALYILECCKCIWRAWWKACWSGKIINTKNHFNACQGWLIRIFCNSFNCYGKWPWFRSLIIPNSLWSFLNPFQVNHLLEILSRSAVWRQLRLWCLRNTWNPLLIQYTKGLLKIIIC